MPISSHTPAPSYAPIVTSTQPTSFFTQGFPSLYKTDFRAWNITSIYIYIACVLYIYIYMCVYMININKRFLFLVTCFDNILFECRHLLISCFFIYINIWYFFINLLINLFNNNILTLSKCLMIENYSVVGITRNRWYHFPFDMVSYTFVFQVSNVFCRFSAIFILAPFNISAVVLIYFFEGGFSGAKEKFVSVVWVKISKDDVSHIKLRVATIYWGFVFTFTSNICHIHALPIEHSILLLWI